MAIDALLIDAAALIVAGAFLLVESVFSLRHGNHALIAGVGIALFVVWVITYFSVFWTTTGQTPGSRVMQIQVTRRDGSQLRPVRALVRLAGMVVSIPLLWGYLPILWNPRRRGVCDLLAGTVVTGVTPPPAELTGAGFPEHSAGRAARSFGSGGGGVVVGDTGLEPVTSALSRRRSPS